MMSYVEVNDADEVVDPGMGKLLALFSVSEEHDYMGTILPGQHAFGDAADLAVFNLKGDNDSDLDDSAHSKDVDWWQAQSLSSITPYSHLVVNSSSDDFTSQSEQEERERWGKWAIQAMEIERQRRIHVNATLEKAETVERSRRRQWALDAIEMERNDRISSQFLNSLTATNWFNETISTYSDDYELVCPYYKLGKNGSSSYYRHISLSSHNLFVSL